MTSLNQCSEQDSTIEWDKLRAIAGQNAGSVPDDIDRMLRAENEDDADSAYWMIDNHVVVQGQLFESALPTGRTVARAICEGNPTVFGLGRAFDLLVEIAAGESDYSEVELGNEHLGDACRDVLRPFVPCFRRFVWSENDQALLGLLDLLDILEPERERLRDIAQSIADRRPANTMLGDRARELVAEG